MRGPGELAIVLHTHMPYVEGFGTWPFGEEWLWEAIASSYLPLLETLDGAESAAAAAVTLSLTPVVCDQLAAKEAISRGIEFLREVRSASHALDLEHYAAEPRLCAELRRSDAEYAGAAARLSALEAGEGLLGGLGRHAKWTSSISHAVLPLLSTDAGVELQVGAGIDSYRQRFGSWNGGFWLPECGYAGWLDGRLSDAGVRHSCVEFAASEVPSGPVQGAGGLMLWPIDRPLIDLVWGAGGYPSHGPYRAYDKLTPRHHRLWSVDGGAYDHARALELTEIHAREFTAAAAERVRQGGICVFAIDTELFGHWWYEGVHWLRAVLAECVRIGLPLTALDDAAAQRHRPRAITDGERFTPSSWGLGRDLRNWSQPPVADLAQRLRWAELQLFHRELGPGVAPRAVRELLALQASDWAFLAYRGWAGDYPRGRSDGHLHEFRKALCGELDAAPTLRAFAPYL